MHVLYFDGDFNTGPEVERHFPDLAQLKNVHIHCISYTPLLLRVIKSIKNKVVRKNKGQLDSLSGNATSGKRSTVNIQKTANSLIYNLLLDPIYIIAKARSLRKTVKEIKPDILHAHSVDYYGFFGALSGFRPFVLSAWGSDVLAMPKSSRIMRYKVLLALKKATIVTTAAEFMGDYLTDEFGIPKSKIVRILWGINLKVFYRGYEEEARKLKYNLGIGGASPIITSNRNMAPNYKIQKIVDAIPSVVKKCPNTIFLFIRGYGTEEFEKEMKARAEELKIVSNVRFVPKVLTPEEMAIYLNMSYALVSIPESDQFGSSILEGMICGVIPIVGELEGYHQYLTNGKNAIFVHSDDSQQLAEKIIYCVEHPELKEKFYEINRRIIEEKEDWDKNAPKMEELYSKLLARKY